ncbi:hypothetical protein J6590_094827 [Homalodisca vitripennis]|nr:hypothetical protein J6590_094827 [Homalodisca vitripennis]
MTQSQFKVHVTRVWDRHETGGERQLTVSRLCHVTDFGTSEALSLWKLLISGISLFLEGPGHYHLSTSKTTRPTGKSRLSKAPRLWPLAIPGL